MTHNLLAIFIFSIIAFIVGIFKKSKKLIILGLILIGISVLGFWGLMHLISCM